MKMSPLREKQNDRSDRAERLRVSYRELWASRRLAGPESFQAFVLDIDPTLRSHFGFLKQGP